jgi:hypothetical protein
MNGGPDLFYSPVVQWSKSIKHRYAFFSHKTRWLTCMTRGMIWPLRHGSLPNVTASLQSTYNDAPLPCTHHTHWGHGHPCPHTNSTSHDLGLYSPPHTTPEHRRAHPPHTVWAVVEATTAYHTSHPPTMYMVALIHHTHSTSRDLSHHALAAHQPRIRALHNLPRAKWQAGWCTCLPTPMYHQEDYNYWDGYLSSCPEIVLDPRCGLQLSMKRVAVHGAYRHHFATTYYSGSFRMWSGNACHLISKTV